MQVKNNYYQLNYKHIFIFLLSGNGAGNSYEFI